MMLKFNRVSTHWLFRTVLLIYYASKSYVSNTGAPMQLFISLTRKCLFVANLKILSFLSLSLLCRAVGLGMAEFSHGFNRWISVAPMFPWWSCCRVLIVSSQCWFILYKYIVTIQQCFQRKQMSHTSKTSLWWQIQS